MLNFSVGKLSAAHADVAARVGPGPRGFQFVS